MGSLLKNIEQSTVSFSSSPKASERKLLAAILERALRDYFGSSSKDRVDAEDWLFSEGSSKEEFSCQWVCEQLDLEKEEVLRRIIRGDINLSGVVSTVESSLPEAPVVFEKAA